MPTSTIAGISYLIAAIGLMTTTLFKRGTPKIDFEVGVAAGLGIAGLLDLLSPLLQELR
jgi:hypothetical protein